MTARAASLIDEAHRNRGQPQGRHVMPFGADYQYAQGVTYFSKAEAYTYCARCNLLAQEQTRYTVEVRSACWVVVFWHRSVFDGEWARVSTMWGWT